MKCNIRKLRVISAAVLLALLCLCGRAGPVPKKKQTLRARIPPIARVMQVQVGKDHIATLERLLGPGLPCMGGHPNGGRAWFIKSLKLYIYADGFDYDAQGRIIDTIGLDFGAEPPSPKIPQVNLKLKAIGWLGTILPGMSKEAVLRLTKGLPKPKREGNSLRWAMSGTYVFFGSGRQMVESCRRWTAKLTFEKNRLTAVMVSL